MRGPGEPDILKGRKKDRTGEERLIPIGDDDSICLAGERIETQPSSRDRNI